ncbi:MAG: FHA domain-containing protein [Deltaproteobacteria bacterium]|nr:FHA domain-containing protein [Deltaproteobacteria bacterium]
MALTVLIHPDRSGAHGLLRLSFDTPRAVVARARSCDVQWPDPTVSLRHASIRHEPGGTVVVDEGSTNGVLVDGEKLPPHTPCVVRHEHMVRVGRVWLELRFAAGPPDPPGRSEAVALDVLAGRLHAQGEQAEPRIAVADGPDAGRELVLAEPDREYVVGRSPTADLALSDAELSRRHVGVSRRAAEVVARDLGAARPALLGDKALGADAAVWRPADRLHVGSSTLVLHHELPEALAEILRAPDERMRQEEYLEPPPGAERRRRGASPPGPAPPESAAAPQETDASPAPGAGPDDGEPAPPSDRFRVVDALVVLLALGVLGLSVAGLLWLLRG